MIRNIELKSVSQFNISDASIISRFGENELKKGKKKKKETNTSPDTI